MLGLYNVIRKINKSTNIIINFGSLALFSFQITDFLFHNLQQRNRQMCTQQNTFFLYVIHFLIMIFLYETIIRINIIQYYLCGL